MPTPTNNQHNSEYCDACYTEVRNDECACTDQTHWGWQPYSTEPEEERDK